MGIFCNKNAKVIQVRLGGGLWAYKALLYNIL